MNGGEILIKVSDTYGMRGEQRRGGEGRRGDRETHKDGPASFFFFRRSFHLNQAVGGGTVSLLCPPVAAAVKNTAGYTSLSAPNWSRSEFYYPAVSRGFHQWLLPAEQFKGGGNQRREAAGKIWTRLAKKINMQRDSMQREQLKAVRVALLLLKALFWERGWLASGLRNTWEWTWYSVITYRWEIWGFSPFFFFFFLDEGEVFSACFCSHNHLLSVFFSQDAKCDLKRKNMQMVWSCLKVLYDAEV